MPDLTVPVGDDDHKQGPAGADLVLVMYGDFECPYCAASQSILRRVRDRLGDRLLFVFRHFPIGELHPHAQLAAEASEAAAAQGAFWAMHDTLYAARGKLTERDLVAHAKKLRLDDARVRDELAARTWEPTVRASLEGGIATGVTGTPGFFANGTRLGGAFDAGSIVAALEGGSDR